jgi:hypothetical protein
MPDTPGLTIRELVLELRKDIDYHAQEAREDRHRFRTELRAIELRLAELEHYRKESEEKHKLHQQRAEQYIPIIDELTSQQKITIAVRQAMADSSTKQWTKRERLMAYALFIFAAVGAIGTVFSVFILRFVQ